MLYDAFLFLWADLEASRGKPSSFSVYGVGVLLALLVLWLLWRLWRFTLAPYWKPDEPKEIPYWIPSEISKA